MKISLSFKRITCLILVIAGLLTIYFISTQKEEELMELIYEITTLKVNNAEKPMGIDTVPKFSWKITSETNSGGQGKSQSAYRIIVSSTSENANDLIGDIWDSEKTSGENNYDIVYGGTALKSKTEYFWRTEAWDESGVSLGCSAVSTFETGIMSESEWNAKWIKSTSSKSALMFRKEFETEKEIKKARIYMSGLGVFVLKINGLSPDSSLLNHSVTQYDKTVPYGVYDVTALLNNGGNAVSIEVGDGPFSDQSGIGNFLWHFYKAPWIDTAKLLFRMDIEYTDQTIQTIVSDETWRVTNKGPVISNSYWVGETYDATKEKTGWEFAGYKEASDWKNVIIADAPTGELKYSFIEPMQKYNEYKPESIKKLSNGSWVITSPEMLTGWISLPINAPRGTEIVIQYGEQLQSDGSVLPTVIEAFGAKETVQRDVYIAGGNPGEIYEPKFSYKGYEYIQIDNYPGEITEDDVKLYRICNAVDSSSSFSTASDYINKLHQMMRTTLLNNYQGRPTDTPVFEKQGYGGDINVALRSMSYNFDISRFILHYENALTDNQGPEGQIPNRAPNNDGIGESDPIWSSVYIFIVEQLVNTYGMESLAAEQYDSMKKLADYYISQSGDKYNYTWSDNNYGDWLAAASLTNSNAPNGGTPPEGSAISCTFYVYSALKTMENFAVKLDKPDDAAIYHEACENIAQAFNRDFFKETRGAYYTNKTTQYRQTSNLLALAMGIVPENQKDTVAANLIEDIEKKNYKLDIGMVGAKYILPVLSDLGRTDIAYKILTQMEYPGWGYWVSKDATSLWECFEDHSRSRDHFFFGTYDEWFHEYLAGVQNVKDGYKTFTLSPTIIPELEWTELTLNTVRGELKSFWEMESKNKLVYSVTIPFGSTAEIHLPADKISSVTLNDKNLKDYEDIRGITNVTEENGKIKVIAGSGEYTFMIKITA